MASKSASCFGVGESSPQAHARKQVGVTRRGQEVRVIKVAEVPHRHAQMEQRTAATDEELAVIRVGDAQ